MKARDMSHLYRRMREQDLRYLRAKKLQDLRILNNCLPSYLTDQDIRRIAYNLEQIDAELRAREDQLDLL